MYTAEMLESVKKGGGHKSVSVLAWSRSRMTRRGKGSAAS